MRRAQTEKVLAKDELFRKEHSRPAQG